MELSFQGKTGDGFLSVALFLDMTNGVSDDLKNRLKALDEEHDHASFRLLTREIDLSLYGLGL